MRWSEAEGTGWKWKNVKDLLSVPRKGYTRDRLRVEAFVVSLDLDRVAPTRDLAVTQNEINKWRT
jgi:hypothetical protein